MEVLANKQEQNMNFEQLVHGIQQLDSTLRDSTVKAINRMTTMRNWLIGAYIVEYEQNGVDRATYGTKLLKSLEEKINQRGLTVTTFQAARLVYRMYPQIGSVISTKYSSLTNILPAPTIYSSMTNKFSTEAETLLSHLSFTHLRELIAIEDPLVRYYNRLLHCSVIIEVKNDEFRHENLGQLNAYVGYYAENEMQPGDNPPVGILLCTKKGKKMVEYALGTMDRQLFVSTYQLQLPNREQLEEFIEQQRKEGFQ